MVTLDGDDSEATKGLKGAEGPGRSWSSPNPAMIVSALVINVGLKGRELFAEALYSREDGFLSSLVICYCCAETLQFGCLCVDLSIDNTNSLTLL